MEMNAVGIFKLFTAANACALAVLLFLAIKPLFGFGVFGVVVNDWRYGYGSGGWTIQHTKTYEVAASGFYPWYRWWFDRWYERTYGQKPNLVK